MWFHYLVQQLLLCGFIIFTQVNGVCIKRIFPFILLIIINNIFIRTHTLRYMFVLIKIIFTNLILNIKC